MSEEIIEKISDEKQEKIIITDNPHKEKNILDINTNDLSKKELLEFDRKDLVTIARDKKLLEGLKEWKISRLSKIDLVKLLKKTDKPTEKKEVVNDENIPKNENSINLVLLQSAFIDLATKQDPKNMDLFCKEVIQNSDSSVINPEVAEKLNKGILQFSIAHLTIRQFGGYKVLFSKGKELYKSLKEKRAKK